MFRAAVVEIATHSAGAPEGRMATTDQARGPVAVGAPLVWDHEAAAVAVDGEDNFTRRVQ